MPVKDPLRAHLAPVAPPVTHEFEKDAVEKVIGGILFDEEREESGSRDRAIAAFDAANRIEGPYDDYHYKTMIKNRGVFEFVIGFVACGASLRQNSRLLQTTKDIAGLGYLTGSSPAKVALFAQ